MILLSLLRHRFVPLEFRYFTIEVLSYSLFVGQGITNHLVIEIFAEILHLLVQLWDITCDLVRELLDLLLLLRLSSLHVILKQRKGFAKHATQGLDIVGKCPIIVIHDLIQLTEVALFLVERG